MWAAQIGEKGDPGKTLRVFDKEVEAREWLRSSGGDGVVLMSTQVPPANGTVALRLWNLNRRRS